MCGFAAHSRLAKYGASRLMIYITVGDTACRSHGDIASVIGFGKGFTPVTEQEIER